MRKHGNYNYLVKADTLSTRVFIFWINEQECLFQSFSAVSVPYVKIPITVELLEQEDMNYLHI